MRKQKTKVPNQPKKESQERVPATTKKNTAQIAQQRQEEILKVASELFLQYGYKKTSLQMIIERTGGSFATIYKFFKNKEDLFQKVIESNHRNFIETLRAISIQNIDLCLNTEKYFYNIGLCLIDEMLKKNNIALVRLTIIEAYNNPNLVKIFHQSVADVNQFFFKGIESYNKIHHLEIDKSVIEEYSRLLVRLIIEPYFLYPLLDPDYQPPKKQEIKSSLKSAIEIFMLYLKNNKEIR